MSYGERPTCRYCGQTYYPHRRGQIFGKKISTCGERECQRKRKTELQRQRRTGQATLPL